MKLAAHSLKSSSANVGAQDLADLCRQLEVAADEQRLDACKSLLEAVLERYQRLAADLGAQELGSERAAADVA